MSMREGRREVCASNMRLWRRKKSGSERQKRARKSDVKEAHKSEREDWGGDGESEGREEAD